MSTLKLSYHAPVAHITINRAHKRNAFTQDMWQRLFDHCEKIDAELGPKVTVIHAEAGSAFCAGADIQELGVLMQDKQALKANNKIVLEAQLRVEQLKCATVASIEGACVGGGLGIALACDFRICTTQSKFAITPAKLGLVYTIEDTRRLVNIVGVARAKEMLLMGKQIDAAKAFEWGLVHKVVEPDKMQEARDEYVASLSSVSRYSLEGLKKTIGFVSGHTVHSEQEIRRFFDGGFEHADFAEGAAAFLEKRRARFS
jgi:enoyl-CoA hydratase/carnithine racemase